ncbi:MAG: DUF460 domain-containing protein [Candidatus Aenigmatarchaeota archaeon]
MDYSIKNKDRGVILKEALLIVGIDPGTTTGVALLDLKGKLALLDSHKEFSRSDLVKIVSGFGTPVIITTDVSPPPRLIEKIAASFPARLLVPRHSLQKREKLELVRQYLKERKPGRGPARYPWKNTHEKDALAAALFAWSQVRDLVARIDKKLDIYQLHPLFPALERFVRSNVLVKKRGITESIRKFFSQFE